MIIAALNRVNLNELSGLLGCDTGLTSPLF